MNKELAIKKEISPIVETATKCKIETKEHLIKATEILSQLNSFLDQITEEKEKITKPLNEALKQERLRWKPIETECEEVINSLRSKMSSFQTKMVKDQKEGQEKIAARVGEGKGKLKIETAIKKMGEIKNPLSTIETEFGGLKFRTDKKLKITDELLIPREYLIPNEALILKSLKEGKNVSECEIEEIQTPINNRN